MALVREPTWWLLWGAYFGINPPTCPSYPPPGLPAIVHHLLGLANAVQLWGFQRVVAAQLCVHQAMHVVCPPIARVSMVGGIMDE